MRNIEELRYEMVKVFNQLIEGTIDLKVAKETSNAAGKIIGTCKVELEYAKMNKTTAKINFLDYNNESKIKDLISE